jgi:hypothetical protein
MSVRIDNDVTLTHADAEAVAALLSDYATQQAEQAKRTRSPAVEAACQVTAQKARKLAAQLTAQLWSWQ